MITDFDELLPEGLLFSLKQINDMGLIKLSMLHKMVFNRTIEVVKVGKKSYISRIALISYLESQTIPAEY